MKSKYVYPKASLEIAEAITNHTDLEFRIYKVKSNGKNYLDVAILHDSVKLASVSFRKLRNGTKITDNIYLLPSKSARKSIIKDLEAFMHDVIYQRFPIDEVKIFYPKNCFECCFNKKNLSDSKCLCKYFGEVDGLSVEPCRNMEEDQSEMYYKMITSSVGKRKLESEENKTVTQHIEELF